MTRILAPSIAFLMASLIALTGATYAWFQTSTQGSVAEINANVISASGMLMSWDANTWKSDLEFDSTYKGITTNVDFTSEFKFAPASTVNLGQGEFAHTFYSADIANQKITEIAAIESTALKTAGIVKFDLYFQVTGLTGSEKTAGGRSIVLYNDKDTPSTLSGAGDGAKTIGLAGRVAFIYQGTSAISAGASAATNLNGSTVTTSQAFIWEPNATVHTTPGCEDYGVAAETSEVFNYYGLAGNTGVTYPLDRQEKKDGDYSDTNFLKKVTTVTDITTQTLLLPEGNSKITVYVWVEGQDHDCTNILANSSMALNLKFNEKTEADKTTA